MARDLPIDLQNEMDAAGMMPAIFVEAEFKTGWLRLWNGSGSKVWNSQAWTGAGQLLSISSITESSEVKADGVSVTLSIPGSNEHLPSDAMSRILNEFRSGNPASIYIGALNPDTGDVITPYAAFKGRMDVPTISDTGSDLRVTITAENRLIDLNRARERRYTDQDQRKYYPDDEGFMFVPQLQELNLTWNNADKNVPVITGVWNRP